MPREWFVPDDRFGWRAVAVLVGVLLLAVAALPHAVDLAGPLAILPLLPIIGAYVYKLTILMHECCHRTLFRARSANEGVGLLCGGLLASSFATFCRAHWQHHRHCGTDDDGEESDYITLQDAPSRTLAFHLIKPLLGYQAVAIAAAGVVRLWRRDGAPADPASADQRRVTGGGPVAQLGAILACQSVLLMLATDGGRIWWLALAYPVTAATFGLFFSRVRAFCEHVSIDRGEGECSVRSHLPNPVDRLFFYTLNMNLHVEHHLYPQVPACHLPHVRQTLQETGYLRPAMTSRSIVGTILRVLAASHRRMKECRNAGMQE